MSTKKMQKTLDTVKGDVRELAEAFWAFREEVVAQWAAQSAESQSRPARDPGPILVASPASLGDAPPSAGHMEISGSYKIEASDGGRHLLRWAMDGRPVEDVLALPTEDIADLLAAIGHQQRLAIVLLLLKRPATANQIVADLGLSTTGAAYHHLNVLQRTGLVQQARRGTFSLSPGHISSLIIVLCGFSGLVRSTMEDLPAAGDITDVPEGGSTIGEYEQED